MIAQKELKEKLLRKYNDILRDLVEPAGMFPYHPRVNLHIDLSDHKQAVADVKQLERHSSVYLGYGYNVESKTVRKWQYGTQTLPSRIVFPTAEDCLKFIGKRTESRRFVEAYSALLARWPHLAKWGRSNVTPILRKLSEWTEIIGTVEELIAEGISDLRAYADGHEMGDGGGRLVWRGLPVSADTKFVERHKTILQSLLLAIKEAHTTNADAPATRRDAGTLTRYEYERLVWVRLLGSGQDFYGSELGIFPLNRFATMNFPAHKLLVVENKLSFFNVPDIGIPLLIIWGQGNACHELATVTWIHEKSLLYWGDLDLDGFRILGRFRRHLPHTLSVCMDRDCYDLYRGFAVAGNAPGLGKWFDNLDPSERQMAQYLAAHPDANRLEQERIESGYFAKRLLKALS